MKYTEFILNEGSYTSNDDKKQVDLIISKSNGNTEKLIELAQNQIKTIKDFDKLLGRGQYAMEQGEYELAKVYLDKAKSVTSSNAGIEFKLTLKKFNDYMSSLSEARKDMPDDLYNALQNVVEFNHLGMDQQGELISLILKKLKQFGVR